jgi:16S rRNA (cytidine1402-2'-O)-methyltransferase
MNKGTVYLIPTVIADETQFKVIPPSVTAVLPEIRYFLVENVRTARRYLSSLRIYESVEPLDFQLLDKETEPTSMARMFEPVFKGEHLGILSEAGCPGIADPGALAVDYAHRNDIRVVPLAGPSSILLSLMASGLNGQRFAFHGYLPIETKELSRAIKEYERESKLKQQTQIFIETPYRNNQLLTAMLRSLNEATKLTVAIDLTGRDERITTRTVKQWKTLKNEFPKLPAVFLFLS